MQQTVNRRPNTACVLCSTPMYRRPKDLREGRGRYCSRACRNRAHPLPDGRNFGPPKLGAANLAWKGGVTLKRPKGNYAGVRYVRCPPEFRAMARADGYIMEHRLVMAHWIGRCLLRTEVVNHKDHDPSNNVRSNLELYPSNGDHKRGEVGRFVSGVHNRLSLPG